MKSLWVVVSALIMVIGVSVSAQATTLIDNGGGFIYDPDLNITWLQDANYAMTSAYDSDDGKMNWSAANTWATTLVYGGVSGWRLPTTLQPDPSCIGQSGGDSYGDKCTGSEMGHLYYTELGNPVGGPLTYTSPFNNVQPGYYWSGTKYAADPSYAWYFCFYYGSQDMDLMIWEFYAWAVHSGDVGPAAVPEPGTALLLGSGLVGLAGMGLRRAKRRRG